MSLVITTDVFCDGTGRDGQPCNAWLHGCTHPTRVDARRARSNVARFGWTQARLQVGGAWKRIDLCGECAAHKETQ